MLSKDHQFRSVGMAHHYVHISTRLISQFGCGLFFSKLLLFAHSTWVQMRQSASLSWHALQQTPSTPLCQSALLNIQRKVLHPRAMFQQRSGCNTNLDSASIILWLSPLNVLRFGIALRELWLQSKQSHPRLAAYTRPSRWAGLCVTVSSRCYTPKPHRSLALRLFPSIRYTPLL